MAVNHYRQPSLKWLFFGSLAFLLLLMLPAELVKAQEPWPPFWFNLTPTLQDGKIRYDLAIYSRVDRQMPDLTVKIPLPEGARFVAAFPEPGVEATFDGREVTFFTSAFDRYIEDSAFVVEQTNPTQHVLTTRAWLSWKGSLPGDYLSEPVSVDLSRQPLNWVDPARSRLQLGVGAAVTEEIITYRLYPRADDQDRMLDLQIRFPLPEGTDLLHFSAPPSFVAGFNGHEVLFSTLELARQTEIEPLTIELSTSEITAPTLAFEIEGSWKNGPRTPIPGASANPVRNNGIYVEGPPPPALELVGLDFAVSQPHVPQQLTFDISGDTPLANYDLTSLAFREGSGQITVIFTTAGELGPVGEPLTFTFFLDRDCSLDTGRARMHRGADFRISYDHGTGRANMVPWAASLADWDWSQFAFMNSLAVGNRVMISVPYDLVGVDRQFCWVSWATNETERYFPGPPRDWLPNGEHNELTRYEIQRSVAPSLTGKLAIPIQNERGDFDTHIFLIPTGLEIDRIAEAHQPNFRFDGRKLLVNGDKGRTENVLEHTYQDGRTVLFVLKNFDLRDTVFEYNLADQTEAPVISADEHMLPFYDPAGNWVVYSSAARNVAEEGSQLSRGFVQCSLQSFTQEMEPLCHAQKQSEQSGAIQGSHPVWGRNNRIAYLGCDSWTESTGCGIYLTTADPSQAERNAFNPVRLTNDVTDIPADTKGGLITFTSFRDGDWEAYAINLNGTGLRNLSVSPASQDGLPTISPDGEWVAFVSDRDGRWAVWVVPSRGGIAQKLFDLPAEMPFGENDSSWTNERISWGP